MKRPPSASGQCRPAPQADGHSQGWESVSYSPSTAAKGERAIGRERGPDSREDRAERGPALGATRLWGHWPVWGRQLGAPEGSEDRRLGLPQKGQPKTQGGPRSLPWATAVQRLGSPRAAAGTQPADAVHNPVERKTASSWVSVTLTNKLSHKIPSTRRQQTEAQETVTCEPETRRRDRAGTPFQGPGKLGAVTAALNAQMRTPTGEMQKMPPQGGQGPDGKEARTPRRNLPIAEDAGCPVHLGFGFWLDPILGTEGRAQGSQDGVSHRL